MFSISEKVGQGCFIPSKRARHRAPPTHTIQGSYQAPPPPLNLIEKYPNFQSSDIHVASTLNNAGQIQNSGFVQSSSVLAKNSQGSNHWGLTVNSQQGNNRGLSADQIDNLNNNSSFVMLPSWNYGQMSWL